MRKSFYLQIIKKSILLVVICLISTSSLFSQTVHQNAKDGMLFFKLKDNYFHNYIIDENNFVDLNSMTNLSKLIEKYQVTQVTRELTAFNDPKCMRIFFVWFNDIQNVDQFITDLSKLDFVEYAELNYKREILWVPNDPYYTGNYKWYLTQIKAEQAWDIQQGSSSVKVAVVDNAVWGAHPDLNILGANQCNAMNTTVQTGAGKSAPPTSVNQNPGCTMTQFNNGECPSYDWSHGTHCAGLVGAINNNSTGIASIAGGVTMLGVRTADDNGDMWSDAITRGINWAAQQGAKVISLSLGGSTSSTSEQTQMSTLNTNGVCVVAAAGNDGTTTMTYPAAYSTVLGVASTDNNKKLSSFSQYGTWVKIAAPGGYYNESSSTSDQFIVMASTTYCVSQMYRLVGFSAFNNQYYDGMQGTSMACPVAAGCCALLKSKNSNATPSQIFNCLTTTSQALAAGSHTIASGVGIIDMQAALNCIGGSSTTPTAQFSGTPTSGNTPLTVAFTDQSTAGTGATITTRAWTFTGGNPASSNAQNPSVTYSVPGTYTVSLTVTNSLSLSDNETKTAYITVTQPGSSFSLDFEACTDFATTFSPWTVSDVDASTTYGIQNVTFTNSGTAMAFMAFNATATTPATTGADAHGGVRQGASFAATTPPNNDWLISPQIRPLNGTWKFRIWVKSYTDQYGLEKYKIGVSTTGNQPANFTTFLTGSTALEAPLTWTLKEFSLASYVNQDVYFGINCVSNDAFIFFIDDISIGAASGIEDSESDNSIHVYPNPAQDVIFINFDETSRRKSQINITDLTGKLILSQEYNETGIGGIAIDASNIPVGMYLIRFTYDDKTVIKKISIAR